MVITQRDRANPNHHRLEKEEKGIMTTADTRHQQKDYVGYLSLFSIFHKTSSNIKTKGKRKQRKDGPGNEEVPVLAPQ
jgi:hypothetical protein